MAGLEQAPQTAIDENEKSMLENTKGSRSKSDLEQGKERNVPTDKAEDTDTSFLVTFDQDDPENPKNQTKETMNTHLGVY